MLAFNDFFIGSRGHSSVRYTLTVESLVPDSGVIFSDGIEADCLPFNSGAVARVKVSSRSAQLVVG